MNTTNAPHMIEYATKSLDFTPHDTKWIAGSARIVCCGISPSSKGAIRIYELERDGTKDLFSDPSFRSQGIKCTTFGASRGSGEQQLAMGDYAGSLTICDLERCMNNKDGNTTNHEIFSVQAAHEGIVNAIDGIGGGGSSSSCGAPELVTGGKDGCVRIWDPRVDHAVVTLNPDKSSSARDCWSVAFGDSYNNEERSIMAGFDNGDIKLYDLRTNTIRWEDNCKNGVTSIQFDRRDIEMNKIVVTTLESKSRCYDMRTQHSTDGFAFTSERAHRSTVWISKHLPQNRDIFMTGGGNGGFNIYKYNYPTNRVGKHKEDGTPIGVAGSVELLNASMAWPPCVYGLSGLSDQPWTEMPAFKTIVTSAMILGKNTPGNTRIYNTIDEPPQGKNPYDPSAYDDSDIVAGFEGNFLQQVNDFIHSTDAVAFHCFDRFEYMWDVLMRLKYFKDVFVTERWEKIESEFGDKYGNGMNAIKYFIYHGFKPFWNPTSTLTGLVLRPKKGKLRVLLVHHSVSYIGHSGPLTNKDGTPLSSSAALGALFDQANRANDPWIITLLNHQLQEQNASLNVSTNLGDFPIAGNALIARDLHKYVLLCLHGDKKLATLLMKFVLAGDVDLIRLHRMVFLNGNCEIVAHQLREGKGPSSARDYWWFIAFVAELAALRNGTKKEAVARAFKCLVRDRTVDGNNSIRTQAIYERYKQLIGEDYKGAFSGEVLQLLQNEWKRYTPDQSVKPCSSCSSSKKKWCVWIEEWSKEGYRQCITCQAKNQSRESSARKAWLS